MIDAAALNKVADVKGAMKIALSSVHDGQVRDPENADMAAQAGALRAIVDDLDYGIVVLDQEHRVQFINRAFRRFWRVPDELADSRQSLSELARQAEALERLASVDGMTGLNNRRNFLVLAESEWSRFRRYGRPLALLMVDIDLFKSINDTYGHDVGDEVIKSVPTFCRRASAAPISPGAWAGKNSP